MYLILIHRLQNVPPRANSQEFIRSHMLNNDRNRSNNNNNINNSTFWYHLTKAEIIKNSVQGYDLEILKLFIIKQLFD